MSRVAERLKELREASGLTQEELEIQLKNEKKNWKEWMEIRHYISNILNVWIARNNENNTKISDKYILRLETEKFAWKKAR